MSKKHKTEPVIETTVELPPPPKSLQKKMYKLEVERAELENYKLGLEVAEQECKTTETIYSTRQAENEEERRGIFSLTGVIKESNADFLRERLMGYGRTSEGAPITLIISSPGGDAFASFMLFDTLRTLSKQGHLITTIVRGMAASGAGVVAQAGDVRLMGSESYLMLHEAATLAAGTASDITDKSKLLTKLTKQMAGIYARKSEMSAEEIFQKMCRTDWWVDAKTAKRLGFADKVD